MSEQFAIYSHAGNRISRWYDSKEDAEGCSPATEDKSILVYQCEDGVLQYGRIWAAVTKTGKILTKWFDTADQAITALKSIVSTIDRVNAVITSKPSSQR